MFDLPTDAFKRQDSNRKNSAAKIHKDQRERESGKLKRGVV